MTEIMGLFLQPWVQPFSCDGCRFRLRSSPWWFSGQYAHAWRPAHPVHVEGVCRGAWLLSQRLVWGGGQRLAL